jgi:DNA-binding NarL/FixJ family response regulator
MNTISITIVDDHKLFAQGLSKLVDSIPEFETVNVFHNGEDFTERLASGMPLTDVILLDVKMPIMDGIATMKWLKKFRPKAKVLALSMEHDEKTIIKMIKAGARGYLLKDVEPNIFKQAIETILQQGYYYTDMVTNIIVNSFDQEEPDGEQINFKEKELIFLKKACEEKTYQEIADEMNLAFKTIDGYRQRVFEKIGVKSRIGLIIYAIKNKIVEI